MVICPSKRVMTGNPASGFPEESVASPTREKSGTFIRLAELPRWFWVAGIMQDPGPKECNP
jgi:hypothetical protein